MKKFPTLSQERLKLFVTYDPEKGSFVRNRLKTVAGGESSADKDGYRRFYFEGKTYKAHRMAWLYVYGELPDCEIDHINGVRHDNRICNLRPATSKNNKHNCGIMKTNSTGFRGVYFRKSRYTKKPFQAVLERIVDGKRKAFLSGHSTAIEASEAYEKAAKELHGKFYREPK